MPKKATKNIVNQNRCSLNHKLIANTQSCTKLDSRAAQGVIPRRRPIQHQRSMASHAWTASITVRDIARTARALFHLRPCIATVLPSHSTSIAHRTSNLHTYSA